MATWSVKYRLAPPNDAKLRSIHVEADNPLRAVSQAEARIPSDALVLGYRMRSGEFVACDLEDPDIWKVAADLATAHPGGCKRHSRFGQPGKHRRAP